MAGALFLQEVLEKEGRLASTIFESSPGRGNLVCRMKGKGAEPPLILLHHIDEVPAEADHWQHPPFSGLIAGGEIWGRGTQDCKSLGIMELAAFLLLKREGISPRRDIVFMATADEETGGKWGVEWLFKNHPEVMEAGFVINEGGGVAMKIGSKNVYTCQTAEKGLCWFKLTFRGKPGHGSVPIEDNCVVKMARAIEKISSYKSPIRPTPTTKRFIDGISGELPFPRSFMMRLLFHPLFSEFVRRRIPDRGLGQMVGAILRNTFVPTVIQGGRKTNVIPSECTCKVDCRILPGVTAGMIEEEIRRALAGFSNYEMEILQSSPASESPADSPLYRSMAEALRRVDPRAKMIPTMLTGATDSRYFRERGTAAFGFEPLMPAADLSGYLGRVHGHDERISEESLLFGTRVLYEVLKDFCA
jgi:acetylornithine deacetylase/succinyl-diaminopimelate desuccinylase-like protein